MAKLQAKKRYVTPELREAKAFADQCGRTYYEAIWRGPSLQADRIVREIAARFVKAYDYTKDLEELDRKIIQAAMDLPVAMENLKKARSQLAALKKDLA